MRKKTPGHIRSKPQYSGKVYRDKTKYHRRSNKNPEFPEGSNNGEDK